MGAFLLFTQVNIAGLSALPGPLPNPFPPTPPSDPPPDPDLPPPPSCKCPHEEDPTLIPLPTDECLMMSIGCMVDDNGNCKSIGVEESRCPGTYDAQGNLIECEERRISVGTTCAFFIDPMPIFPDSPAACIDAAPYEYIMCYKKESGLFLKKVEIVEDNCGYIRKANPDESQAELCSLAGCKVKFADNPNVEEYFSCEVNPAPTDIPGAEPSGTSSGDEVPSDLPGAEPSGTSSGDEASTDTSAAE